MKKIFIFFIFCLASTLSYALPFNVQPAQTLPTTVAQGSTVTAYYTVSNRTATTRNNNYVKYLPPNVTQVVSGGTFPDTCGSTFNLTANQSCTLQLTISGPVNGNDPDIKHHLFICFPGGLTCAGTNFPLNVSQTSASVTRAAYVVGSGSTLVQFCPILNDGSFGTCTTTNYGSGLTPLIITTNPTGTFSYITLSGSSSVRYCSINQDGTFSNCANTGNGFASPRGIAINPAGTFVYVTSSSNSIYYCPIKNDGSFDTCTQTATGFNALGITINPAGTFAYISGGFGQTTITYCTINLDGSLSGCTATGSGFTTPLSVAINPAGTFAYIINSGANTVSNCSINTNGSLSNCVTAGTGFSSPSSIKINSTGTLAYITNSSSNDVSYCILNVDGTFNTCAIAGSGFSSPSSIQLVS